MTTGKRRIPINGEDAQAQAEGTRPNESAAAGAGSPSEAALEDLTREKEALADSLLRLRAEFDNYRKRAARDLVEARERSQGELLSDMLPVFDNLERALDAAEHHDEGKVLGGVRMTRDLFAELLRRTGVEEVAGVGSDFDPVIHDAIHMQPSDQPEGTVSVVLERGYRLGDRVLRPARVIVSSGLVSEQAAESAE
jgi:molecular chaperone GrpE